MTLAALTFSGGAWTWPALLAAAILLPLAWWALRPAAPQRGAVAVGLGLRTFGVGLLLLTLLDPQWTSPRPKRGANLFAVLADNSQGLQISDAGSAQSRGEVLRTMLDAESPWLTALADEYQVRRYTFDRDLRRVADFTALDFRGERTDLGLALRQLRERFANQPLAGVLVLTDGNATDLPDGLTADTTGLPPVFPVVLGRQDGLSDLRLERVELRQTAFDDAPVTLRVEVAGQGTGNQATVRVRPFAQTANHTSGDQAASPPGAGVAAPGSADLNLAQRLRLRGTVPAQAEFQWRPEGTGVQFHEVEVSSADPEEEATLLNNRRIVLTDRGRAAYRILYVGGRINWEFKFLNRALADDPQLQLVGLLRLAHREPKFEFKGRAGEASNPLFRGFDGIQDETTRYDQPVLTRINTRDASELRGGFPRTAEELFGYDALVLDDLEAGFFSPDQLLLVRRFVSERGGGLLVLGGVDSLEHGGYRDTTLAAALPVYLDRLAATRPQGQLTWRLTREGWLQPWTRVRAQESDEQVRIEQMPSFLVANALAAVKPGATVLATLEDETGETYPALVAQPFGSGRVATIGVGDLWRWGFRGAGEQADLARFWRQISRWLVTDVPAPVELRIVPADGQAGIELRVTARELDYRPLESARVQVTVQRLGGIAIEQPPPNESPARALSTTSGFQQAVLTAEPTSEAPGRYSTHFHARDAGAYLATAEVHDRTGRLVGRAEAGWVHDPAADEFRSLAPNRPLLEELARRTGGAVLEPSELAQLSRRLASNPAPIMETTSRPLWHNGWVFLAVLGCFLGEWAWRRWRGLA